MVDSAIIFELRVKVWLPDVQTHRLSVASKPPDTVANCIEDFGALRRDGFGSDIVLKTNYVDRQSTEGDPLRAHRLVLAARSPVFRQMFFGSGTLAEAMPGAELCLSDMEPSVAQWFLDFLYTGKVDTKVWEDDDAVCHLLSAGHKYEVASLVESCVTRLASSFSEENAAERLMMADLLDIRRLREAALEYMCASSARLSVIQDTDAFARLGEQRPKLALEILAKMVPAAGRKRPCLDNDVFPTDLDSKTNTQLKQYCSDRGLATSGNKETLIRRLRGHFDGQNQTF